MPNTKSAERRARSNIRRNQHNRSVKSRLKSLEKRYQTVVASGKKDEAVGLLREVTSALDKAAKVGVIHCSTAHRKKSRLNLRLAKISAPAAAPSAAPAT